MVPKIKSRKYSQKYLNFEFTTTEVNDGKKAPARYVLKLTLSRKRAFDDHTSRVIAPPGGEPHTLRNTALNDSQIVFLVLLEEIFSSEVLIQQNESYWQRPRNSEPRSIDEDDNLEQEHFLLTTLPHQREDFESRRIERASGTCTHGGSLAAAGLELVTFRLRFRHYNH
ncbi:hypothetical protein TNCV_1977821 [Trichonephila clavipes]|nr:hypothetical protein TNCV_1977821 [Trichonephila clavipes]